MDEPSLSVTVHTMSRGVTKTAPFLRLPCTAVSIMFFESCVR